MRVACFAGSLFLATFLIHVVIWRIRLPVAHTRTLLIIFLGALPVAFLLNVLLPVSSPLRIFGFWQYVHVGMFHLAMSVAYIEFYTGIEGDSPTLTMLLFVEQAGDEGRSEEQLYQLIGSDFIVGGRLQAMVSGGFVTGEGGVYRLTKSGRACARLFQAARRLWHVPLGG